MKLACALNEIFKFEEKKGCFYEVRSAQLIKLNHKSIEFVQKYEPGYTAPPKKCELDESAVTIRYIN